MNALEKFLTKIAEFQYKYWLIIMLIAIGLTAFLIVGIKNLELQTDMDKEMPQELPVYQLNYKLTDKFGGQDATIILFNLAETSNFKGDHRDIRDPEIIDYMIDFEETLSHESIINSVASPATILQYYPYTTTSDVMDIIDAVPELDVFFSDDYKTAIMFISSDVGSGEAKIKALVQLIDDVRDGLATPSGVEVLITGNPPMRTVILKYLTSDSIFTITLASLIILILLFIMQRSILNGILVFVPLALGLVWTMGTMGWLGLKLSIATVGLGAMILGLGVEYGVFMLTRYKEARAKTIHRLDALKEAVPAVGSSVLGSGTTTIVGFMALTLSVMPMMQHLGQSLALGILFCLTSAVFVEPVIIIVAEKFEVSYTEKKFKSISRARKRVERLKN